jgi:hypothetical protein
MKRLFLLLVLAIPTPHRGLTVRHALTAPHATAGRHADAASIVGELQSAFLQRATGRDRTAFLGDEGARVRSLQRHFEIVLAILGNRTERSVEQALARLETSRGDQWSASERVNWRTRLLAERELNLERLRLYRDRGRFPRNEHAADRAVPVFVDNYDTACAVGHLMRESGAREAVEAISAKNNLST